MCTCIKMVQTRQSNLDNDIHCFIFYSCFFQAEVVYYYFIVLFLIFNTIVLQWFDFTVYWVTVNVPSFMKGVKISIFQWYFFIPSAAITHAFIYTFNLYICVISESVVTMRILREIYFLLYITGSRLQEVIKKLYGRRYMLKYVLSLNLYTFMTNNTKHISFVLSVQMHVKHTFWWNNVNSRSTKYNKVIFLYLNCHYRCLIHYRSLRPWY